MAGSPAGVVRPGYVWRGRGVPARTSPVAWSRFTWTQYPGHGPDESVLGDPTNALDLGCGRGAHAAHLARRGVQVTGVDNDGRRLQGAEEKWGHILSLDLVHQDAVDYLRRKGPRFSAIYSIFGALWFTDPKVWLPLVRSRLKAGGVLAFSQEAPIEGCYGCQGEYVLTRGKRLTVVRRWAYSPAMWHDLLHRSGFQRIAAGIIDPPEPGQIPTLIVRARV